MRKEYPSTKGQRKRDIAKRKLKALEVWKLKQFEIDGEIWLPIPGYETRYFISSKGRFRIPEKLAKSGDVLLEITNYGYGVLPNYKKVQLQDDLGKRWWKRVHVLVCLAFIPNPLNKKCVNHIDGNKHNNCVENLEWCTHKENLQHSVRIGLYWQHGSNHYKAKFTEEEVRVIFDSEKSINDLAKEYNVMYNDIWHIKTGRCWTRVTGKKYISKNKK